MKQKLEKILGFDLEATGNTAFGDYTANVVLQGKGQEVKGKSPREYATDKVTKLQGDKELAKFVDRIEVAGPGFINFWLKTDVLIKNLAEINKEKEEFGKSKTNTGKLAIVEYSSANIAKPFTIGHLRSTIIGDAVANLLEITGWEVLRDNHLGDWGTQFGKQIAAIKYWGNIDKISESENPVKELVNLYVKFHEEAQKDSSLEDEAREWFAKLENGDSQAREIWQKCIEWSFKEFDRIYSILGIKFSNEFQNGRGLSESYFENRMTPVIEELKSTGLLTEGKEGAQLVFFKNEKYPPAMILKKDGSSLYHTRDLATDKYRKEKYNPDLVINEVGLEQKLYFEQLFEMEYMLGWFKPGQRVHLGHGLVRFKDGKMSTRKGNVIWMEDVLNEARQRAEKLGSESTDLAKTVAIGALKYNDLKRDPKTEIVFDWNEILNMEGNSGPYLQYTVARCNSVILKANNPITQSTNKQINNRPDKLAAVIKNDNWMMSDQEQAVLRLLVHFSEVVEASALNYSPNLLCNYLYDLAQKFNTFYNADKIIGSDNEDFRLALTIGTAQILKNGLKLLGIESPDKM